MLGPQATRPASGAPGTAPAMTGGQASWLLYGNVSGITAHNWLELANNPALVDLSFVYSDTVNDEDLFTFGALSVTPDAIYTVAVKGSIRREAGGLRRWISARRRAARPVRAEPRPSGRGPPMSGGAASSLLIRTPASLGQLLASTLPRRG